jgi:hypothetical protein
MARLGWLKGRRRTKRIFRTIRSHLEIAADERVAGGADRTAPACPRSRISATSR